MSRKRIRHQDANAEEPVEWITYHSWMQLGIQAMDSDPTCQIII